MNIEALFLDRDGTINQMVFNKKENCWDSPQHPDEVELTEGIIPLIRWANDQNIPVIEITNQPGVAKGKMSLETLDLIEKRVQDLLLEQGVKVDTVYRCLHHPKGKLPELTQECDCRKPKPGLLLRAADELKINLTKCVFLGDGAGDATAGRIVGCTTIILLHDHDLPEKVEASRNAVADYKTSSLSEVQPILEKFIPSNEIPRMLIHG